MATIPSDPKCTFTIPFAGITPDTLLRITKREIATSGGSLSGNAQRGRFTTREPITLKAVYRVRGGNQLDIFVTEKPFGLPCFTIESGLGGLLKQAIDNAADEPDPGPIDPTPDPEPTPEPSPNGPPARPSIIWTTSVFQRRIIAAGAPKIPGLQDGRFGRVTRDQGLAVLRKLGFPNAALRPVDGGRKVAIQPVAAATRLVEVEEKSKGKRMALILGSVAGIVALTGLLFLRRRARLQESG